MTYDPKTDRRTLLGSGLGMAAFAVAAAGAHPAQAGYDASKRKKIPGASLKGPYLNLIDSPRDNMLGIARISGDIDCKTTTHGWYDGLVMGTAPGGPIKNHLRHEGHEFVPHGKAARWRLSPSAA